MFAGPTNNVFGGSMKKLAYAFFMSLSFVCIADAMEPAQTEQNKKSIVTEYNQKPSLFNGFERALAYPFGTRHLGVAKYSEFQKLVKEASATIGLKGMPVVFALKGNLIFSLAKHLGILDLKCKMFSLSLCQSRSVLFVGEDLLTDASLSHSELKVLIAKELAHMREYHDIKKLSLTLISLVASVGAGILIPISRMISFYSFGRLRFLNFFEYNIFLIQAAFGGSIFFVLRFFSNALKRHFTYEADLVAANAGSQDVMKNAIVHKANIEKFKPTFIRWFVNLFKSTPLDCRRLDKLGGYLKPI